MTIQTNPEAFYPNLPVQTVVDIDRLTGIVTLSDGTTVALNSWGNSEWTQPVIETQVQLLPDASGEPYFDPEDINDIR
jgi:hypothetical protein